MSLAFGMRRDSSQHRLEINASICDDSDRSRHGVTLLELMVALGLLAMLLLVAWSLFDNLQKAEQRSEGLANRVQVLRQIRTWLAADLDQLVLPSSTVQLSGNSNISNGLAPDTYFVGDPTGFITTIAPSIDPLPFLQGAFESPNSISGQGLASDFGVESDPLSVSDTDQDRAVREARSKPWTQERMNVEYRLESQSKSLEASPPSSELDLIYKIVRRERLFSSVGRTALAETSSSNSSSTILSNSSGVNSTSSLAAADRQLTIQDLYRQSDETLDTSSPAVAEKALAGIQNAAFQYFDGISWRSDWDSREQGSFPAAIAIEFDFPSRTKARLEREERRRTSISVENSTDSPEPNVDSIDALLAQQPIASREAEDDQQFLVESSAKEVTIVVATHDRSPRIQREESASGDSLPARSGPGLRRTP